MASQDAGTVTAVLGPTNTGKTHLAVERMCAHASGMIGFPLRLLAREIYDRVVKLKGANRVALVTGEEKIVPKDARWWLCTVESMPDHSVSFVGIDEAQLGADRERGHVFTDRLLNLRGRDETMILGSASLKPLVRTLVPEAESGVAAAVFDAELCGREQAVAAAQAQSRSSRSAPRKSMPSPKCCGGCAAGRRW